MAGGPPCPTGGGFAALFSAGVTPPNFPTVMNMGMTHYGLACSAPAFGVAGGLYSIRDGVLCPVLRSSSRFRSLFLYALHLCYGVMRYTSGFGYFLPGINTFCRILQNVISCALVLLRPLRNNRLQPKGQPCPFICRNVFAAPVHVALPCCSPVFNS